MDPCHDAPVAGFLELELEMTVLPVGTPAGQDPIHRLEMPGIHFLRPHTVGDFIKT